MLLVGLATSGPLVRNNKSCIVILVIITLLSCCILYNMMDIFIVNGMQRRYSNCSKAHKMTKDKENHFINLSRPVSNVTEKFEKLRYFNSSKAFKQSYTPFLEELGLIGDRDLINLSQPLPNVTFITAVSENHVGEGRSLIQRLAKDHPDWKIYMYDIGMRKKSRSFFEKACNVAGVRDIDLAHFGVIEESKLWKYFGIGGLLKSYRWKPIEALKEFPVIFWMDSSTFFAPNIAMDILLDKINIIDREEPNVYLFSHVHHSTYAVTSPGMYDYLAPQSNIYQRMYEANKQLIIRTKATIDLVLKWLVLCALEPSCMAPKSSQLDCSFSPTKEYANCHRYDQSAINIILSPYPRSFVGSWTDSYIWTMRDVTTNQEDITC